MESFYIILTFFVSLILTALMGKILIPSLIKFKFGQTILKIGPSWHIKKQGTPTMGGLMFIFGILFSLTICTILYNIKYTSLGFQYSETPLMNCKIISGLIMAFGFGLIGFIDDFIKIKRGKNLGLNAKQKLILQFLVASMFLGSIYLSESFYCGSPKTFIKIPFIGSLNFDLFYWIFSAFVIVGIVNAVNLNDGIDGLCGSVSAVVALGFLFVSQLFNMQGMGFISSAMFGGCIGFLIWNFHPAKVFMGDTGSLALGGFVAASAYVLQMPLYIPVIGLIYTVELLSVVIQVSYFKATHGKRIFKMTPIHHHFELSGWSETRIVTVFTVVTVLCVLLALIGLL